MLLHLNEDDSYKTQHPWGLPACSGTTLNFFINRMYNEHHDVVLTRALNKEFLSVAAQQGPREEGGKVHKDLSQQRSCLLQSVLQTFWDTGDVIQTTHKHKQGMTNRMKLECNSETNLENVENAKFIDISKVFVEQQQEDMHF